ncbi:hypothetical protein RchiOBHm_Chr2g0103271 [Rosa chinensis]|uniref:Uncharacterized protein n=1 Tax=Rosa chinensis TaxID=74649 RepID=A0A2P6RMV8_ROSCH|nr:hypothetical protein RchiOBHm_Chr2g0103271 [Rosa chinensis]
MAAREGLDVRPVDGGSDCIGLMSRSGVDAEGWDQVLRGVLMVSSTGRRGAAVENDQGRVWFCGGIAIVGYIDRSAAGMGDEGVTCVAAALQGLNLAAWQGLRSSCLLGFSLVVVHGPQVGIWAFLRGGFGPFWFLIV